MSYKWVGKPTPRKEDPKLLTGAHAGYGIVVADRDEPAARACASSIEEQGTPARAVGADVRAPADLDRIVAVARELGDLKVLVNNAGGWTPQRQYPQATPA